MNNNTYTVLVFWMLGLFFLIYFVDRADFGLLFSTYCAVFVAYYLLLNKFECSDADARFLLIGGITIRFASLFAFPFFSDDIYRFWWDGHLLHSGISPFENIPRYYIEKGFFTGTFELEIFNKLNSPDYYSVYPPVCQFVFFVAYYLFPKNIIGFSICLKMFLFLSELGTLFYLKQLKVPLKGLLVYALNPLIVIELCGNAHFEAAMIFFFVAALYHLNILKLEGKTTNIPAGALLISLSVSSKLLTLIFFPFLFKTLGWKKGLAFFFWSGIFSALFFCPFYDRFFAGHFSSSLALYFQRFEFNASLFYVFKEIGNAFYGYTPVNIIAVWSNALLLISGIWLYFSKRDFFSSAFIFLTIYLLLQRAVHPWYLSTLLMLSAFVPWRYGILWSGLIILSYSHYQHNIYRENYFLLCVEYFILYAFVFYELCISEQKLNSPVSD